MNRYVVTKNKGTESETEQIFLLTSQEAEKKNIHSHEAGKTQNEIIEENFVDWLAQNYTKFGCTLELISDRSQEGTQFVRGFGGIGGILRYKMDMVALRDHEKKGDGQDDSDDDNDVVYDDADYDLDDDFV